MKKFLLVIACMFLACDTATNVEKASDTDTVYVTPEPDLERAVITFLENGAVIQIAGSVFIADTIRYYSSDRVAVEWKCPCEFEATMFISTGECYDSMKTCRQLEPRQ